MENSANYEQARKKFLELTAESNSIKSKGQAIAEAKAKAEAADIAAKADVTFADLKSKAKTIREMAQIEHSREVGTIELEHQKAMSSLKIRKTQELAQIESGKFKSIMDAISRDTLVSIAKAGPEAQSQMLNSLGLQGYLLMDSKNPINLFTAAEGMISTKKQE